MSTGLKSILKLREWLRVVLKAVTVGEVDFATVGHGELQAPDLQIVIRD